MVNVRTGAYVYTKYGFETGYAQGATINKGFGLKTSIGSLTLTNNRSELGKLGQVEVEQYAFGQQNGNISVNYVLADSVINDLATDVQSAGDIFRAIFGTPSGSGTAASPAIYPSGGLGQGKTPKTSESLSIEVGFETSENSYVTGNPDYKVRTLKGCVLNNLSISTAVGDVVNVAADFSYGDEDAPNTSYSAPTIVCGNPYTFANAKLKLKLRDGSLQEITLVQDTDISFGVGNELLFGLSSNQAVDSFRKMFDITGRFKVAWYDWKIYERVLAQIGKGLSGVSQPNISTAVEPEVELELLFENEIVSSGLKKFIKIELSGVSITDLSISGLEPVEPVYQEINYKAKAAKVQVVHSA